MGLEFGDMKRQSLMVVISDGEVEISLLGDRSSKAWVAIRHTEADGLWQGGSGEVELVDEGGINKGFLST